MKGKFGGLLSESKQKLADSKQKLQQSKLLNESRAAAKHLLADSKVLLEEGKAGLKTKLAGNVVSKLWLLYSSDNGVARFLCGSSSHLPQCCS
jgi:hypothetical protein